MPQAGSGDAFLHEFPWGIAAAYLFHLAQNHPFIDGNERVALSAALVFLEVNGITVDMSDDEVVQLTLEVASGKLDKASIARCFASHAPSR